MNYTCRIHLLPYMAAFLACVGFASCSQDELTEQGTPLPVGQYPLELTAGGLQAVAAPSPASTRGTVEGNWEGVQSVMVLDATSPNPPKAYQVTANGNTSSAILTSDDPFWWTSTDELKIVEAWHPARHPDDPTINFENRAPQANDRWSVPADQSSKDFDANAYDFIYPESELIWFNERKNASLKFQHLLTKVVVNLMPSSYLSANSQDISVSLVNCALSGIFYNAYGTLLLGTEDKQDKTLTMRRIAPNAQASPSFDALVIPQSVQTTNMAVLIKVGAVSYTWPVQIEYGLFKPGWCYTFNITVKEHGLDVKVDNSIGWDSNGASGSGSITFPNN